MSPVLKKRHSKSYVPLFSKNQGFALLHIPFLSPFFAIKKAAPFQKLLFRLFIILLFYF